jgi:pimeloyl-ACP methyl ester carboxylesterase
MPVVFVHGNPETAAIWDDLLPHLERKDVVTLSPPGFGAPVPEGFGATSEEYVVWLVGELDQLDGPIDLVGHDWGGGHVMGIAVAAPEMIRSWVTDIAGVMDPEYAWHDMAQIWQTPGAGEEAVAAWTSASVEARAAQLEAFGMNTATAAKMAPAVNEDMGRCILALYRSAIQPVVSEWGKDLPNAAVKPGLVIIAPEDHMVGGEVLARRQAERAGAQVAMLPGLGHWWMCEDRKAGAAALNGFFEGLR